MTNQITFCKENIEVLKGTDKFVKASNRNNALTSERTLTWMVEEHEQGYYYTAEGTRVKASQFVNRLGESIRKPRGSKAIKEVVYGYEA